MKMELWIRSQGRTFLRKVNTIGIVEGRDFWSIDENYFNIAKERINNTVRKD